MDSDQAPEKYKIDQAVEIKYLRHLTAVIKTEKLTNSKRPEGW